MVRLEFRFKQVNTRETAARIVLADNIFHAMTRQVQYMAIDSFPITWWLWKPVQLDGHLDWLHFDNPGSLNNCTCSCMKHWHDSFRSRGIKMELIKVAIQLPWFLWPPRYVKLVYTLHTKNERTQFIERTRFILKNSTFFLVCSVLPCTGPDESWHEIYRPLKQFLPLFPSCLSVYHPQRTFVQTTVVPCGQRLHFQW